MWICCPWWRGRWRSEVGNNVWEVLFTLNVAAGKQMTFWSWQHCLRGPTYVACGFAVLAGYANEVMKFATLFERTYFCCMWPSLPEMLMTFWSWQHCLRGPTFVACGFAVLAGDEDYVLKLATLFERSYLRCNVDLPSLPEMQMTFWSWQHCLRAPIYVACGHLCRKADDVLKLATLFERSYLHCTWTCHLCRRCRWRSGAGNTVWEVLLTLHVDLPSLP
jgi:hypothetical protein